jgi:manganese-dependent inorganic pyrophosphatase
MAEYVEPGCLVILGDREEAQLTAIKRGAAALVITGDLPVSQRTLNAAQEHGVLLISTGYHTFTTMRLVNLSINVELIMRREYDFCNPEDLLNDIEKMLMRRRMLPVADTNGKLVGYLTRTDLVSPQPKRVILVDHNERSQAVDGIEEAELLGIIDHHRIADVMTSKPIMFRAEPVGCTGTIIARLYEEAEITIPREMAGLLLAGLLYDTLILRSPTCTPRDEQVAAELAAIAGEDLQEYGAQIFAAAAAAFASRSIEELLTSDFKEFTVHDARFAIGTIETASPASIDARSGELLETMRNLANERGYASFLFMIVDIINLRCQLLISGNESAVARAFGVPLEKNNHTITVEGLVSRKKQVVPQLTRIQAFLNDK